MSFSIFSSSKRKAAGNVLLPMTVEDTHQSSSYAATFTSYLSSLTHYISDSCQFTIKKAGSIAGSVVRLGRQLSSSEILPRTQQETQNQKHKILFSRPESPQANPIQPVNNALESKNSPFNHFQNQQTQQTQSLYTPYQ